MPKHDKPLAFEYMAMPCIPQGGVFDFRGWTQGVDMPLRIELFEFGINTIKAPREQEIEAPPFNRLFYLVEGLAGEIVMQRRRFPLHDGRMYLIPLGRPFRMRFRPPGVFGYVHFTAGDAYGLDVFREVREVRSLPVPPWLPAVAPPAHALAQAADALVLPLAELAAIAAFMRAPDVEALWLRASASQPLQKVLALIRAQNSARLRVHELAAMAGMSPSALSQAFRRAFGRSLKSYLTQDLLQRVLHSLNNTNKTIRQIAQELGFSRPSHLAHMFRRAFGLSPLKYRATMHPRRANRRLYSRLPADD